MNGCWAEGRCWGGGVSVSGRSAGYKVGLGCQLGFGSSGVRYGTAEGG